MTHNLFINVTYYRHISKFGLIDTVTCRDIVKLTKGYKTDNSRLIMTFLVILVHVAHHYFFRIRNIVT